MTDEIHIGVDLARPGGDETAVSLRSGRDFVTVPREAGRMLNVLSTDKAVYLACEGGVYFLRQGQKTMEKL